MNNCCLNNDIVDIVGLCNPEDIDLTMSNFWTEIVVDESLILPEQKPDIEQINSVNISVQITRKKVVPTPISTGPNYEGKLVTGRKLIVEGLLCQTISYTALVANQSLHTAHFQVPFSAFIVVDKIIGTTDTLKVNFDVIPCVEDVFIVKFSNREIFKNVNLFLQAIPAKNFACSDEC
jgi:hypothetical protein